MKLLSFLILSLTMATTVMANEGRDFHCVLTSAETIQLPPPRNRPQHITKEIKVTISANSVKADVLGDWYKNFETEVVSHSSSDMTAKSYDWDLHEMNPFEVGVRVDTIKVSDFDSEEPRVTLKREEKAPFKKSWLVFYGEYSCIAE